jgi:hypothetical protein
MRLLQPAEKNNPPSSMDLQTRISIFVVTVTFLPLSAIGLYGFLGDSNEIGIREHGIATIATVVERVEARAVELRPQQQSYWLRLVYNPSRGPQREAWVMIVGDAAMRVRLGDQLRGRYDPADPSSFVLLEREGFGLHRERSACLAIIAALAWIAAIVLIKKGKDIRDVNTGGRRKRPNQKGA